MTEEREKEPSVEQDGFEWAIVEVLGHRKHAGRVREEERFGQKCDPSTCPFMATPPRMAGKLAITARRRSFRSGSATN